MSTRRAGVGCYSQKVLYSHGMARRYHGYTAFCRSNTFRARARSIGRLPVRHRAGKVHSRTMSDLSQLRVADADREQLIDELREHAIAGRLTSEELEERIGGAYLASTRADLDALRGDVPV